jgi:hypothetical protein
MIGILLALQVNNWNEERKEQKQMLNYVEAIYADMLIEQEQLSILIDRFKYNANVSASIMKLLENPGVSINDSMETLSKLILLGGDVGIDRKPNTWDELKSTGKFQGLENKVLIGMLTDHYQVYDKLVNNFNRLPLKKLDELKEIASTLYTSHSIRQFIIDPQFNINSSKQLERFITQKDLYELISSIGVFSIIYNRFYIEVKDKAEAIISYIEENYSHIPDTG